MALYPSLFGYIEGPSEDARRPVGRPRDVRIVRKPRSSDPSRRTR